MKRKTRVSEGKVASEMAVVDTFTKLIFGQDTHYSDAELLIIDALRSVDTDAAGGDNSAMGRYLRALGVREMIALVSRVCAGMSGVAEGGTRSGNNRRMSTQGVQQATALHSAH